MSKKKIRILFAAVDIGYRIPHYTKYLEENYGERVKVESFSKYVLPKEHYEMKFTYECPIDKTHPIKLYAFSLYFFIRSLFKYDVFHFFSGETILTRKLRRFELMTYKLFNKKIIMHFVGSDIRSNDYLSDKNEHIFEYLKGEKIKTSISEDYQLKLIADAKKYADEIIVSTPDLLDIIPEATYIPVFLDVESLESEQLNIKQNKRIKILHSPSGKRTKGTEHIHKVLNEIANKRRNDIELIIPVIKSHSNYPMTRYNLLKVMQETDIVIDQMVIGWYGLKSIEALYCGANVLCYLEKKEYLFDNTPIISSNIVDLEINLNTLIDQLLMGNNRLKRQQQNVLWIKKNHSIDQYKLTLAKIWELF